MKQEHLIAYMNGVHPDPALKFKIWKTVKTQEADHLKRFHWEAVLVPICILIFCGVNLFMLKNLSDNLEKGSSDNDNFRNLVAEWQTELSDHDYAHVFLTADNFDESGNCIWSDYDSDAWPYAALPFYTDAAPNSEAGENAVIRYVRLVDGYLTNQEFLVWTSAETYESFTLESILRIQKSSTVITEEMLQDTEGLQAAKQVIESYYVDYAEGIAELDQLAESFDAVVAAAKNFDDQLAQRSQELSEVYTLFAENPCEDTAAQYAAALSSYADDDQLIYPTEQMDKIYALTEDLKLGVNTFLYGHPDTQSYCNANGQGIQVFYSGKELLDYFNGQDVVSRNTALLLWVHDAWAAAVSDYEVYVDRLEATVYPFGNSWIIRAQKEYWEPICYRHEQNRPPETEPETEIDSRNEGAIIETETMPMPDMTGYTIMELYNDGILSEETFQTVLSYYKIVNVSTEEYEKPIIVKTEPAPGEALSTGQCVTFYVASPGTSYEALVDACLDKGWEETVETIENSEFEYDLLAKYDDGYYAMEYTLTGEINLYIPLGTEQIVSSQADSDRQLLLLKERLADTLERTHEVYYVPVASNRVNNFIRHAQEDGQGGFYIFYTVFE